MIFLNNRIKLYIVYLTVFFIAFLVLLFVTINNVNIANQNTVNQKINTTNNQVNTNSVNQNTKPKGDSKINFDYNYENYIIFPPFQKIANYQDDSYINKIKNCEPNNYELIGKLAGNGGFDLIYYTDFNIVGLDKNNSNICIITKQVKDLDVYFSKKLLNDLNNKDMNAEFRKQLLSTPESSIKNMLKDTYSITDKIRAWAKVVLVEMVGGTHNVEVLPVLEKVDGTSTIPNSVNDGGWENVDPRKQLDEFQTINENTNGLTAELGRMMKSWKNTSSMTYSSYELLSDIMAFLETEFKEGADYEDYYEVVKNFFDYLKSNRNDSNTESHIETAYNRAVKAIEYMDNDKTKEASEEWRKVFGDKFPKVKENPQKEPKIAPPIISPIRPWSKLN